MTNFTKCLKHRRSCSRRWLWVSLLSIALITPLGIKADPPPPIFNGVNLKNWRAVSQNEFVQRGKIFVEDGVLHLSPGQPGTGVRYTGKIPRDHYEIQLEAKRVDGFDFFCGLTFPVGSNHCTFIAGGWDGDVMGLSNIDHRSAADNETTRSHTFVQNQWYTFKLRVDAGHITVWMDQKKIIHTDTRGKKIGIRHSMQPLCPLGLCGWYTEAHYRNIRLTRLPAPLADPRIPAPPSNSSANAQKELYK